MSKSEIIREDWNAANTIDVTKAVWSTAYVNDLPDSAFLYVAPGGKKDSEGKTVPRGLRHFPVKDAEGKVDLPHLRNALARIPQAKIPPAAASSATNSARRMLGDAEKAQKKTEKRDWRLSINDRGGEV